MKPSGESQTLQIKRTLKLYRPTDAQLRGHMSKHPFNVLRWGRQSGKSTWGNNRLLDKTWRVPDSRHWYVGPTYRLANQMFERALFSLKSGKNAAMRDCSATELMIELLCGGRIYYLSGENLSSLPGETLNGAIVDECRDQRHLKELWTRVLFPMLGTTGGGCDFLSTPNGFDYFYDLDQKAKTNPSWGSFHAPSWSNPLWTPQMLREAKEEMSEDLYAQEIEAEFRDLGSGSCASSFGEHNTNKKSPFAVGDEEISANLPILVGMDFNLNPMSWVLGQYRNRDIHYHDEIYLERSNTPEAAEVLCERVKGHKLGVVIIGDASGKAGQRAAAGESDYSIIKQLLKAHGIPYRDLTPESNPTIKDRVNTFNAGCKSADGSVHLTFGPKCKRTVKDIQKRKWKEGAATLAFDNSDPMAGHLFDAASYPSCVLAPIKPVTTIKMHVINRTI